MKRLALLFCLCSLTAFAQCVFPCINDSAEASSTAGATQTLTGFTVATGGNTVTVAGMYGGANANTTVTSLAMTNVTWTSITTVNFAGSSNFVTGFLFRGIVAGGPSGTTLTVVLSASVADIQAEMIEVSGLMVPTTLDTFGTGTLSTGTTINSSNVAQCTTTVANDFILAGALIDTPTGSVSAQPGGNYQNLTFWQNVGGSGFSQQANFSTVNSATNQSPGWTYSGSIRSIGFAVAFKMPVASAQCSPIGPDSRCPGVVNVTGNIANTSPLVYGAANVTYSTMGNTAARKANYSFLANDSPTATTGHICVGLPGGGWDQGDSNGDFLIAANSSVSLIYLVQQRVCRTITSANYTKYAGGSGTNAPAPAAWNDAACYVHWIAHNAGVLFPGNANDIILFSFSAGTQMQMALQWGLASTTCEYSDPYNARFMILLSPSYNYTGQWNATWAPSGTGLNSTFSTAVTGEWNCALTPQTVCPAAFSTYDARGLWMAASNPTRVAAVDDGATAASDPTNVNNPTNPTYQGAVMIQDMGAAQVPYYLEPGVGHGGTCHTTSQVTTTPCWIFLTQAMQDNSKSFTLGGLGTF